MLASLARYLGSACAARIWVSVSRPCVCFVHSWSVGNFSSPPLDPSRLRGDTADVRGFGTLHHRNSLSSRVVPRKTSVRASGGRRSRSVSQDDIDAGRPAVGDEGGVGGQTDLLDPGEARFWRALPGEGDGTYVARAAALAHPVLRCFVTLPRAPCGGGPGADACAAGARMRWRGRRGCR